MPWRIRSDWPICCKRLAEKPLAGMIWKEIMRP